MLISFEEIQSILSKNNIHTNGVLHIGAHDCEELYFYNRMGVRNEDIIWIDAIPAKVIQSRQRGIPNVFNAIITDKDDETLSFHISNNVQSSSIFEFGTHTQEHPHVVYVDEIKGTTTTIDTFFSRNGLEASKHTFWNFDIQGAELLALKGSTQSIKYANALYLEVNEKELYKGCALIGDIDSYLSGYGFHRVLTQMTQHGWGDALYIKQG